MKRILFLADSIPPIEYGGIPNVAWNQAIELSKRNKLGIIINSTDVKNEFKRTRTDGIDIYTVPRVFPNWSSLSYHYRSFSNKEALTNILSEFQPDIFHVLGYFNLDVRDIRILRNSKTKVVREVCYFDDICLKGNLINANSQACSGPSIEKCTQCYFDTYQSSSNNYLKRQIKTIAVPWLIKKQDKLVKQLFEDVFTGVVFPSQSYKDFFGKYVEIENKSAVIPHGINLPRNKKKGLKSSRHIKFGFTNTLQFRKGIGVVLEAFKQLIEQNIQGFKLLIWGAPIEEKYLQEVLKLEDRYPEFISYEGNYTPKDIPEIANNVDIGIVPSYTEVCPLVVREWLTQGVPCIMANCFGSEIIKDNCNGFIIPTGDVEELFRKMKKLIDEPILAEKLIKGAGETFIPTIADECKELESFYEKLSSSFV